MILAYALGYSLITNNLCVVLTVNIEVLDLPWDAVLMDSVVSTFIYCSQDRIRTYMNGLIVVV